MSRRFLKRTWVRERWCPCCTLTISRWFWDAAHSGQGGILAGKPRAASASQACPGLLDAAPLGHHTGLFLHFEKEGRGVALGDLAFARRLPARPPELQRGRRRHPSTGEAAVHQAYRREVQGGWQFAPPPLKSSARQGSRRGIPQRRNRRGARSPWLRPAAS
jgi:hypothetical protein